MKRLLGVGAALLLVAGVANAVTYIGVNFTGDGVNNWNGNFGGGPYYGATSLGANDTVFGQNHWNNYVTGDGGNVLANDGTTVMGSMSITQDTALPSSTRYYPVSYNGTASPFADPGSDLTQILYNGFNNAMNHGTITFTYLGADATYTMNIFGSSSGVLSIYNKVDNAVLATTAGVLGGLYTPGYQSVQLSLVQNQTIYFGAHGNGVSQQAPYYENNGGYKSPGISAFQFVGASGNNDVPEPGTWLLLGGSLLGLCAGGFRRFVRK